MKNSSLFLFVMKETGAQLLFEELYDNIGTADSASYSCGFICSLKYFF